MSEREVETNHGDSEKPEKRQKTQDKGEQAAHVITIGNHVM
jgi:hypothetical protein